jgi:hypothetical protein
MTTSSRQLAQANLQEQQPQGSPAPFDDGSNRLQQAADVAAFDQQSNQQQEQQHQEQQLLQQSYGLAQDPQAPQQLLLQQQQHASFAPHPIPPHQQQDQLPVAAWPAQQQHQQIQPHQQLQQQQQAQPAWLVNINAPVGDLLRGLGLQEYEALLQQQAVDLAALQLMEERHLRELGLPIGAVVKLKAALATMR